MVHEFSTTEGQARLSRALKADYQARDERKAEQARFEHDQVKPWFDSLTTNQKNWLAEWLDYNEPDTQLGLIRIIDQYNEQMNELENKDI